MDVIDVLKRSEVFLGLGNEDLQKIIDLTSCQEKTYQGHDIIFRTGEYARCFYVLEEGQANLIVGMPEDLSNLPKNSIVRTINKGGTFGWSALVPPHSRILSAVSKGYSKVLAIDGEELQTLLDEYPHIGYEVISSLLRVILSGYRNIEQLFITGETYSFLERKRGGKDR